MDINNYDRALMAELVESIADIAIIINPVCHKKFDLQLSFKKKINFKILETQTIVSLTCQLSSNPAYRY